MSKESPPEEGFDVEEEAVFSVSLFAATGAGAGAAASEAAIVKTRGGLTKKRVENGGIVDVRKDRSIRRGGCRGKNVFNCRDVEY